MIYADYDYYANEYFGQTIQDADFPRLALHASQYITQGRAKRNANLGAVKMCCCALAEQYLTIETAQALAQKSLAAGVGDGAEVQTESVGSWSKSYRSGGDSAQAAAQAAEAARAELPIIACKHLSLTGLLYRGGRRCW